METKKCPICEKEIGKVNWVEGAIGGEVANGDYYGDFTPQELRKFKKNLGQLIWNLQYNGVLELLADMLATDTPNSPWPKYIKKLAAEMYVEGV
jgi:hypothetical protein